MARMVLAHGYALLTGEGGVLVVDVRDPFHPHQVGLLPTGDQAADMAVQDGLMYASAGDGGLYVFAPQLVIGGLAGGPPSTRSLCLPAAGGCSAVGREQPRPASPSAPVQAAREIERVVVAGRRR
jgi:hypothetical protein